MGAGLADQVSASLIAAGRAPATPVAIVENGTRPDERVLTGRLDDLGGLVARHAVTGPAMLFVGEVAAFAECLRRAGPSASGGRGMKVLTANRLSDGRVLYWGAQGLATEALAEALWLDDAEAEARPVVRSRPARPVREPLSGGGERGASPRAATASRSSSAPPAPRSATAVPTSKGPPDVSL